MKKIYVLIFLMSVMSSASLTAQPDLGAGVKGGINLATQVTTGTGENVAVQQLLGFNAGAYVNLFINNFIGFQPELILSTRGSNWDDPYYDVSDLLTYVDIPLLVKFQPIRYANIHAGPQVGLLLNARQKDDETGDITNIREWYNFLDLGIAFGAEANLPYRINITLRYVIGLISATNDVQYYEPWRNNFLQISAGFRLTGDK